MPGFFIWHKGFYRIEKLPYSSFEDEDDEDTENLEDIRLLSKLALLGKTGHFCADLADNFEGISEDMAEKLDAKDAKKGRFNKQMEFRKKSI